VRPGFSYVFFGTNDHLLALEGAGFDLRRCKMKKLIIATVAVAFSTAIAQSAEFYVVQDVKTKKCTIVDKKPTTTTETTIVGDGKVYKTRTEAETGMKSVKVCTSN
jgi:hypothetical protein